uniref:Uncharacterized protein n=1 Tax=Oryza sativa subsp. japonica TaxID=39947 RepID=Q6ZAR5_ORYSJ|nr:hypothetical protein [Oryza sativa Japonica Group]BAD03318.1 hypothetical protein [Oryza sativa Japonica Group]
MARRGHRRRRAAPLIVLLCLVIGEWSGHLRDDDDEHYAGQPDRKQPLSSPWPSTSSTCAILVDVAEQGGGDDVAPVYGEVVPIEAGAPGRTPHATAVDDDSAVSFKLVRAERHVALAWRVEALRRLQVPAPHPHRPELRRAPPRVPPEGGGGDQGTRRLPQPGQPRAGSLHPDRRHELAAIRRGEGHCCRGQPYHRRGRERGQEEASPPGAVQRAEKATAECARFMRSSARWWHGVTSGYRAPFRRSLSSPTTLSLPLSRIVMPALPQPHQSPFTRLPLVPSDSKSSTMSPMACAWSSGMDMNRSRGESAVRVAAAPPRHQGARRLWSVWRKVT